MDDAHQVGQVERMSGINVPLDIGFSYRIYPFDFQWLMMGVVVQAASVYLTGIVSMGFDVLPLEISGQKRLNLETLKIEILSQVG